MPACSPWLLLLALAGVAPEREPRLEVEARVAQLVSEQRALKNVRELVQLGPRMGGTASGQRAVDWRERVFQALSLPTEVIDGNEAWSHEELGWTLRAHVAGTPSVPARVIDLDRAWPYGFSPGASGRAALSLESIEGAARLCERTPRRAKRGRAPAVILVDGQVTPGGGWPAVRHLRRGDDNPAPVFGLSSAGGAALRAALSAGQRVEIEYQLSARIERSRPRTVVASLAGRPGAPPGFMLFCAHGDSDAGGPGANDNGSGEAIVVEIATAWSRAVTAGLLPAPVREVRFAIWGSEIASTRHYLEHIQAAGSPLLGVVNFDQAGFGSTADLLFIEPDELPGNRALLEHLLAVLKEHQGQAGFPQRWATNASQGGTDSYVFSNSPGFRDLPRPALTLYTSAWDHAQELARSANRPGESWNDEDTVHIDYDVYYHSAGDLPANTTDREPWNMAWIARVALLGSARWLEAEFPTESTAPR